MLSDVSLDTWLIFLLAAAGLSLTPGPNGLLALTNGALVGFRRTLFTIAGGAAGFFLVIAISMFGIGALLAASSDVLIVLKVVGGAYLVYLGIQVWRSPTIHIDADAPPPPRRGRGLFTQGFFAAATNPKGILFFVAFLPQFLDPGRSLLLQFFILSATFVVIEIGVEAAIARASQALQPWLARVGRTFNRVTGGFFIGIGVLLPFQR